MGKAGVIAVIAILLISLLAIAAQAASGPSVTKTAKKEAQTNPEPGKVTPEEGAKFKCSQLETMNERVKCRLKLSEENEYDYLPEECRSFVNASRDGCVSNYRKSQKCWDSERDSERFKCAASAFGLVGTVAEQKAQCNGKTGQDRSSCILELRDRVDAVVKFRIYNLEEKAQRLMEHGQVDIDTVTAFVEAMEQQKQNYNDAKTTQDKKAIILGIQKQWQSLMSSLKEAKGEAK